MELKRKRPNKKLTAFMTGAVLLTGSGFCLAGCTDNVKARAEEVAVKALSASVERPESIEIHAISRTDSVFGKEYVTMEEKLAISQTMMKVNEKVMKETDGFENLDWENREIAASMERQMSAMAVLRSIMSCATPHWEKRPPFTGWKVKIDYGAKTEDGKSYRSEYWFILDKNARCVVKSFEIPLL